MMSPFQLEERWLATEKKIADRLSAGGDWARLFIFAAIGLLVLGFTRDWWHNNYPEWTRFYAVSYRFNLALALVIFSFISIWIRLPFFLFAALLAAWTYNLYKIQLLLPIVFFYPIFFLLCYAILFVARRQSKSFVWLCAFVMTAAFFVCIYLAGRIGFDHSSYFLELFWVLHPEYALIAGLYWLTAQYRSKSEVEPSLAIAPSQVSFPLPIPASTQFVGNDLARRRALWWRGSVDFVRGLIFYYICMGIAKVPLSNTLVLFATHQFIYYGVSVSAAMSMTTGLIRMYGFDAPSASNFLFLARSPLDVWRRGSVYVNQMVLDMIFLPMMRLTKSLAITTVVCLLFVISQMFLMHEIGVKAFYAIMFSDFASYRAQAPQALWAVTYFTLGWLILILLHRFLLEPFLRNKLKQDSWGWVILTMGLVVGLMMLLLK